MEINLKKILIADDSKTFLMYMGILLKRMGFSIVVIESGKKVLKLVKKINPDIVMPDVNMVDMNGTLVHTKEITSDIFKVPPGMGIKFTDISDKQSLILKKYISRFIAEDIVDNQEETVIEINDTKNS